MLGPHLHKKIQLILYGVPFSVISTRKKPQKYDDDFNETTKTETRNHEILTSQQLSS